MDKIISFDYFLTGLFERIIPHNIFFDYFFSFFSMIGLAGLIWIIMAVLLIFFEEIKHKKFILFFSMSLLLTYLIANIIMKNFFHRLRPSSLITNYYSLVVNCPVDFSFPSGHAATAFAGAVILSFFDKKRTWFYYTVAVLISFSRIYLGCHYFLDVISGVIVGYLISKFFLKLFTTH